ncbi:hypothetical protein F4775DRAFT_524227 [Biscogniauxia sp. FL1348]|nr:hypothetical protein F4775DRAFT_524227 [Biscogniauxia sp. FL1348]
MSRSNPLAPSPLLSLFSSLTLSSISCPSHHPFPFPPSNLGSPPSHCVASCLLNVHRDTLVDYLLSYTMMESVRNVPGIDIPVEIFQLP